MLILTWACGRDLVGSGRERRTLYPESYTLDPEPSTQHPYAGPCRKRTRKPHAVCFGA